MKTYKTLLEKLLGEETPVLADSTQKRIDQILNMVGAVGTAPGVVDSKHFFSRKAKLVLNVDVFGPLDKKDMKKIIGIKEFFNVFHLKTISGPGLTIQFKF